MFFFKLIAKTFSANLKTKIDPKFLYRSSFLIKIEFRQLQKFTSVSFGMPAKKATATNIASKRKGEKLSDTPLVKDPFAAAASAKKTKLDEKKLDNEIISERGEAISDVKKTKVKSRSPSPVNEKVAKKAKVTNEGKARAKSKKKENEEKDEDDTPSESKSEATVKYDSEEFKTPSNGKEYNLKIVSWNVNGIRAWIDVIRYYFSIQ